MSWERALEMHALGWGGPGNQQTLPGRPKTQSGPRSAPQPQSPRLYTGHGRTQQVEVTGWPCWSP